jgi:hypothetical protein
MDDDLVGTTVAATPRIVLVRFVTVKTSVADCPSSLPLYLSVVPGVSGE